MTESQMEPQELDSALIERIESLGLGQPAESERGADRVESMIVVGEPFVEIVKIANDLDCDLIVLGIRSGATPAPTVALRRHRRGGAARRQPPGAVRAVNAA